MKVYHGSAIEVPKPDIAFSRETVDFGRGFYLTPLRAQAVGWAVRAYRRVKHAYINTYEFHDEQLPELSVKRFPKYDAEWLDFVWNCRFGKSVHSYDVIIGGVANDNVFDTLELLSAQLITREKALERLIYEKPNNQICICRQELIERLLSFDSAERLIYEGK